MGACLGVDKSNQNARMRSEAIDRELMQMAKEDEHIVKILLLGKGILLEWGRNMNLTLMADN